MRHTHRKVPLRILSGVPVIQPGRRGEVLARVDITFSKRGERWQAGEPRGELLPSDATIAPDAAVAAVETPFEHAARRWLDETVAEAEEAFPADKARLEDTALLDLINDAQLKATGADLSVTSLLPGGRFEGLPKGHVTMRDLWALYPYENRLVVVEIDGAQLKACLEHAAAFYGEAALAGGRIVLTPNPRMIPYDFDALQGASYRIDPTEPVGRRVKDLVVRGRPVRPSDRFTVAVNSYRAQGGGGYSALRHAKIVKSLPLGIRELLVESFRAAGHLRPVVDHNWVVAPDAVWVPSRPTGTPARGKPPQ
ncbi:MAG: bifunctional metallophosphatase/5'-nucleotidase [Acidithiobacillales bacterium]